MQCGLLVSRGDTGGGSLAGSGREQHDSGLWLSIPDVGLLLTAITKGRKELVAILQRRRPHHDILLADLKKKQLKCGLSVPFLMRDMLGSGLLKISQTSIGPLVQLPAPQ